MAFQSYSQKLPVILILFLLLFVELNAKLTDNDRSEVTQEDKIKEKKFVEPVTARKINDGAALLFADELKVILDRYLFGICPQSFKMAVARKNGTTPTCDLDPEQQDLAGRLATLALRVHSAARADCSRLGAALANTLGELARTAASRQVYPAGSAEANKKRKLSKSQKAKLQAKQRTALAVKKKAAAAAASTKTVVA